PEAINALETYLKRAPANDAGTEAIQKRLANLKAQAAADASAKPSSPASASAMPTAPSTSASVAPPPTASASAPPSEKGHSLPPYILMAGGVVALGVGIPLAIIGTGNVSDANDEIRRDQCDPDNTTCPNLPKNDPRIADATRIANGPRQNALVEQDLGIALIGVGVAAVVGGLVWHFVEPTGPTTRQSGGNLTVRPDVRPGYSGLFIGGAF
ncbi:MAG: hypothetical protein ACRELY_04145, partial [Polyangiaceae bacterium]